MTREEQLFRAFVELADTLVDDFDVVDFLTVLADRCVELLDVDAAGLMIIDPGGTLRAMASSSEEMRLVEVFELQAEEGPCLDCFRSAQPVLNVDLDHAGRRWPSFAPVAAQAGFRSVNALPMRCHGTVIGAFNIFRADGGTLAEPDVAAAQALADVATIGLVQNQALTDAQVVAGQLQRALNSRIIVEQAKGILSGRSDLGMDEAFERLRGHARRNRQLLGDIAEQVIDGSLPAEALEAGKSGRR